MITTVTLNPAIDKTIILEEYKYGYVNRVQDSREDIGGKGINVSKVIQTLGEKTTAVGFLGRTNKSKTSLLLNRNSLITDFIWIDAATRMNTKIVDLKSGVTTDLNESGFHVSEKNKQDIKVLVKHYAKQSDYMVFSGSVPPGCHNSFYYELIQLSNTYTKTVLDADGDLLKEGLKAHPYLIKPNIHELENCFKRSINTTEEVIQTALKVVEQYKVHWVLVSMGEKGSILASKDTILKANPVQVEVKSSVGAGDSMLGGFLSLYLKKENALEALRYAAACGAAAVTKEGTERLSQKEIDEMLVKIQIENMTKDWI